MSACLTRRTRGSETKHSRFRQLALALVCAALPFGVALAAGAQPRAWVSGLGADAATCGAITSPCRTLQYSHDNVVAPGGSIYVKDPANYGQLTIRHAISIINDGSGTATILAPSGDAVNVNAGPTDAVLIKGLILDGAGSGLRGVVVTSAGALTIQDCTIQSFRADLIQSTGVRVAPNPNVTISFLIDRSRLVGNLGGGVAVVADGGGAAFGQIRGSIVSGGTSGVLVATSLMIFASRVVVEDTVIQGAAYGLYATHAGASLVARRAHISGSGAGTGVDADNGATVSLSASDFSNNATDLVNSSASTLNSYGDNSYATATGVVTQLAKQ